jgi:hypothetical protein
MCRFAQFPHGKGAERFHSPLDDRRIGRARFDFDVPRH